MSSYRHRVTNQCAAVRRTDRNDSQSLPSVHLARDRNGREESWHGRPDGAAAPFEGFSLPPGNIPRAKNNLRMSAIASVILRPAARTRYANTPTMSAFRFS